MPLNNVAKIYAIVADSQVRDVLEKVNFETAKVLELTEDYDCDEDAWKKIEELQKLLEVRI